MKDNQQRLARIKELLAAKLQPDNLEVIDESHKHADHPGAQSGAGHFYLKISSPLFQSQTLINCHRMIYQALEELLVKDIHALRIKVLNK